MADIIDWFISNTSCTIDQNKKPTRYQCSLKIPDEVKNECYLLRQVVWEAIISDERIATLERKAKTIIGSLFEEFTGPRDDTRELFPSDFRERLDQAKSNFDKARVACDYIAGMTDAHAFRMYSRLREPDVTSVFEIL
jgi:dGTPase